MKRVLEFIKTYSIVICLIVLLIGLGIFKLGKGTFGLDDNVEVTLDCPTKVSPGDMVECNVNLSVSDNTTLSVNANFELPTGFTYQGFGFTNECLDEDNTCIAEASENGFAYGLVDGFSDDLTIGVLAFKVGDSVEPNTYNVGLINVEISDNEYNMGELSDAEAGIKVVSGAICPSVQSYTGTYDGESHSIIVGNEYSGGTLQFRTASSGDGSEWTTTQPSRTEAGATTVQVRMLGDDDHSDSYCYEVGTKYPVILITSDEHHDLPVPLDPNSLALIAAQSHVYNGSEQGSGITCPTGSYPGGTETATDVGEYTITCTSMYGGWSDGSLAPTKSYPWGIIAKNVTITAKDQTITEGNNITTNLNQITSSGLVEGHSITAITLTSTIEGSTGTITPSAATIKDGSNKDVTSNYNITYANGTVTVTTGPVNNEYFTCDSPLAYDGNDKVLWKILPGTTKGTVEGLIQSDVDPVIVDNNNNELSSSSIMKTGYKINLVRSNRTDVITISVVGDINGTDGAINSADLLKLRQHLIGTSVLTGANLKAADVTRNGSVDSADLLRMRQHLIGTNIIG